MALWGITRTLCLAGLLTLCRALPAQHTPEDEGDSEQAALVAAGEFNDEPKVGDSEQVALIAADEPKVMYQNRSIYGKTNTSVPRHIKPKNVSNASNASTGPTIPPVYYAPQPTNPAMYGQPQETTHDSYIEACCQCKVSVTAPRTSDTCRAFGCIRPDAPDKYCWRTTPSEKSNFGGFSCSAALPKIPGNTGFPSCCNEPVIQGSRHPCCRGSPQPELCAADFGVDDGGLKFPEPDVHIEGAYHWPNPLVGKPPGYEYKWKEFTGKGSDRDLVPGLAAAAEAAKAELMQE